jgi:hypothetical protein
MAAPRRPSDAQRAIRTAASGPVLRPATEPGPDAVTQARDGSKEDPRPAQAGERGKPTRITIDLAAELYSYLRGYARGRDIAAADVVRELIRQMRNDPDLSARVTAELARRREALAEAMRAARE